MLIAEVQLLSCRGRKSFLLNPWQLHTLVNLLSGVRDAPGFTLCLSELASRLLQAGSNGQENNQVESRTLRPRLGLKVIVPF